MRTSPLATLALLNVLSIFPCVQVQSSGLLNYPFLEIVPLIQKGAEKYNLNYSEINDYSNIYFELSCKSGDKSFHYHCQEEECCTDTAHYDTGTEKATLPKVKSSHNTYRALR
jgi:hypothetical protein